MRILHINSNYILSPFHQTMIENLDEMGIENNVFVAKCEEDRILINPNDNVKICNCYKQHDRYVFFLKQKKIINAIESEYDINSFDLIHAYTVFTDGNVARYLSRKYGIPFIVAVRNTDVNIFFRYRFYLRGLGNAILKDASAICFLSEAYKEKVLTKYVIASFRDTIERKISIIPNGIDRFWLENKIQDKSESFMRIRNRKLNIIFAGRIDKNKNIPTTCRACEILIKKGWNIRFCIIGRVEDESVFAYLKRISFCELMPPKQKDELIYYYREADIFVMPSFTETFGLVYAEAMTQGLPVIYSRGQGFDKQFDEGVVGFSVSSSSAEEIVDKIEHICDNYETISNRCVQLSDKYSWDNIINEYINMYNNILQKR